MTFNDIKIFKTFEPNSEKSDYTLFDPESSIIDQFRADVGMLESSQDFLLCCRGDSKKDDVAHERFMKNELDTEFLLGSKAAFFYREGLEEIMNNIKNTDKTNLIDEINQLLINIKEEMISKPRAHSIENLMLGQITTDLKEQSISLLNQLKLFLISWRHNIGKGKNQPEYKKSSPLISLTYGNNKYTTASDFALKNQEQGYLYVSYLDKRSKAYFMTGALKDKLKKWKINWYADIHSEIMLLGGILPHYILGIIEVTKSTDPQLIINPWLYQHYKAGRAFKFEDGIPVDQTNFLDWYDDSSYQRFFIETPDSKQYVINSKNEEGFLESNTFDD